jgi:site-specific recombinase XerD
MMLEELEELERRNYAQTTINSYIRTIEDFARHFRRPPDQLTPEHIREYQAYLCRQRKLGSKPILYIESLHLASLYVQL